MNYEQALSVVEKEQEVAYGVSGTHLYLITYNENRASTDDPECLVHYSARRFSRSETIYRPRDVPAEARKLNYRLVKLLDLRTLDF
jgi:hypothetical protein